MRPFFIGLSFLFLLSSSRLFSQPVTQLRIPATTVSFLTFAPDARSAAMGEAGVALSADANSAYWNASKLPFAERDFGASASYTPWLRTIVNDMWLGYASAYKKLGKGQAISASVNYFNNGNSFPTISNKQYNSSFAINATYAKQLGRNFSMGLTLKYISSNMDGNLNVQPGNVKPGKGIAADVSAYYKREFRDENTGQNLIWSLGAVLSNFGTKINYGSGVDKSFIPTTFKLGGGLSFTPDGRNRFNFILDATKLMVPTPVAGSNVNTKPLLQGVFGSFSDAPGGFREEIQEVTLSGGAEYWYKGIFALRGGYFGQNKNKGNRKYFTAGAGVRFLKNYGVDFAYLFPVIEGSPLAQTLRVSLSLYLDNKNNQKL